MGQDIGSRVRYWRKRRGMTQVALAGLADLSQAYVSEIEAGIKPVERRKTLVALAEALQVTVADLLNQPGDPTDPLKAGVSERVPEVRLALIEIEDGERRQPVASRDELDALLDHLTELRSRADFAGEYAQLPQVLPDAAAYGGVPLARAAYLASTSLRRFGYRDLALAAARISLHAAAEADHVAWQGAARFAQVLAMPPEAAAISSRIAVRTLGEMQAKAADREVRQVLGQLHLSSALAAAVGGDGPAAEDRLREAEIEASTLGDPVDGQGFNRMGFGPTNCGLWRMSVVAELGDHERVLALSTQVRPDPLRIVDRHQTYWIERGRAFARAGTNDRQAEVAFIRAERLSPLLFAANPLVRDSVSAMARRSAHRSVSDDLRVLARRVGVEIPV